MKHPTLYLSLLFIASSAFASPSMETTSIQQRHDLLLLNEPAIAWPYPLGRIGPAAHLSRIADHSSPLTTHYVENSQLGWQPLEASVSLATDTLPFRSFGYQPREQFETSLSTSWLSERTYGKINLSYVDSDAEGNRFRLDGSSFAVAIGNWSAAIDRIDRWWGPGWDGSLILSNNARPIPAVSLTRIDDKPIDFPVLRWIGPWSATTFMGQLDNDEGERDGSNARLFGLRVDFSPLGGDWLDIGLSRTAQWAGDGRPGGLSTFWKALIGEDNRVPGSNVTEENEPGNQLAGIDYRLKFGNVNFAQYGQGVGEDEQGFLPDAIMLLFGAETWGELPSLNATWRTYFEWADTRAGHIRGVRGRPNRAFNVAYNHGIYRSGYRYKGRSMGHAMDGDGLMSSLGAFIVKENGDLYGMKLRSYKINRDGRGPNSVSIDPLEGNSIEFFAEFTVADGLLKSWNESDLKVNLGVHYIDEKNLRTARSDSDFGGYLSLTKEL